MAFKSFIISRFDHTHENIFFRTVSNELDNHFSKIAGQFILVGNLSVGGHALDAIFIKNGAIVVIDFKDYSGKLSFSENGPWRIRTENDKIIFVAGGGGSRNPFQQVNAYRFSLIHYLSDRGDKILEQKHDNISWAHICGMAIFHRSIIFDNSEIPAKIQRYFHVADYKTYLEKLCDVGSTNLAFTDKEIHRILDVLSISSEHLYDATAPIEETEKTLSYDPDRMQKIQQLLPESIAGTEKKVLSFYNTMISLERLNEASVTNVFHLSVNWAQINFNQFHLDITTIPQFLNMYLQNARESFPKNLFVSLNVYFDGEEIPLFYSVFVQSEIDDYQNISIDFNSFDLFTVVLSELNLTEDIIEDISRKISEERNILDKLRVVSELLEMKISLGKTISVGLSDESRFTLQLQAEYNNWLRGKVTLPEKNSVLKSFLTNEKISSFSSDTPLEYVQITNLNTSQKRAVKLAFNQRLSIITGPPGTGKSQVVVNIMANAVINNHKVLFASKNNKAVDNVYQKINGLLDTEYFVRFGNNELNSVAEQVLNKFVNQITAEQIPDKKEEQASNLIKHKELLQRQRVLQKKISDIPVLQRKIIELNSILNSAKNEYSEWISGLSEEPKKLYIDDNLKYNVSLSSLNEQLINLNNARGFIGNLSFKLLHKQKATDFVKSINNSLPVKLAQYIESRYPYFSTSKKTTQSFSENLNFIKDELLIQQDLSIKNSQLSENILISAQELETVKRDYDELAKNETRNRQELEGLEEHIIDSSRSLVSNNINEKVRNADPYVINRYTEYLMNGIPWKDYEKQEFSAITNSFLSIFNTISISNLTVKKAFLQEAEIFDILIIDEASQCDIASVLPMIFRARRVVILGDPLQLPHITSIKKPEQDYVTDQLGLSLADHNYIKDSLFIKAEKVSHNNGLKQVFLNEHYRCHPEIIQFSNNFFYQAMAGQELDIKTKASSFTLGSPGLHWIDSKGSVDISKNVNLTEVEKCIEIVTELSKKYPSASIGIVTPFSDQKKVLQQAFLRLDIKNLIIDTVHRFQGDEKDIIVFSLVVTDGSKDSLTRFINYYSSYLLNVGITRAKSSLIIVGNKNYCKNLVDEKGKTLLSKLASYSETIKKM
ncbi:AAA domain-containing protein [Chryseobacterium sp. SL1]|uniref:AAA domain-containing protein n=1 Tax=Chryseobacterium sp. SL1 TaxID=2995159 RepID=UPI002276DDEA|nr:AAA domain-containing protein [Chryseobacterium sp. SL1]MCY1660403.1 AAA domain-containing protein [Chryseobacterium sp. SL1]